MLGAQRHGVVQESLELDLGIAQHVGIGRAAGGILAQELGEDAVLVFGGEIDVFEFHADQIGDAGRVQQILAVEQYSESSSSSQFFMNRPTTS